MAVDESLNALAIFKVVTSANVIYSPNYAPRHSTKVGHKSKKRQWRHEEVEGRFIYARKAKIDLRFLS